MTPRLTPRLLLPAVLLLCLSAGATTLLRVDVPELARSSDAIVQGTVRRMESRWSGDGRRIVTDVEIQVAEALKGQPGDTVLVTQPGGRMGDVGQKVSGEATFTPGEEVVVFLQRRGAQAFRVAAMVQGKYQVQRSADGARVMAVQDASAEALVVDPTTRRAEALVPQSQSLEALKGAIRTALAAPATQEKRP